jgi:hypothetical protein
MKYIKTRESYGYDESKIDIREFFANLKKFSYDFKDYYNFKNFLFDAQKEINANKLQQKFELSYFGYTNGSFFIPIIDKLTIELHKIFQLIIDEKYDEIYEYFNSDKSISKFEYIKPKYFSFSTKTYCTKELARLFQKNFKPYYKTRISFNKNKNDKDKIIKILEKFAEESKLNKDYNISIYSEGEWNVDVRFIKKIENIYTSEQELKIQEAREFGNKKYKDLCWNNNNIDTFKDMIKYNL